MAKPNQWLHYTIENQSSYLFDKVASLICDLQCMCMDQNKAPQTDKLQSSTYPTQERHNKNVVRLSLRLFLFDRWRGNEPLDFTVEICMNCTESCHLVMSMFVFYCMCTLVSLSVLVASESWCQPRSDSSNCICVFHTDSLLLCDLIWCSNSWSQRKHEFIAHYFKGSLTKPAG